MIKREDDGLWIVIRETISSHHEDVFACLTTPEGLSRWFPLDARVDLRAGGQIVLGWDKDFRRTTTVAILDYDTGGRVVWDWQAAHLDIHAPVYWDIKPSLEKGAVLTMRQGPFRENTESLIAMAEEAQDWQWQVCNLRGVLEVKHDMRLVRPL